MVNRKWEIITTLLRLANTVEAALTRHLTPYGIVFTDLRLMLMILVLQGVSQKELATHMGVSQVVVSTRLDKLERAALVARLHVGRRRVSVTLTASGSNLLDVMLHSVVDSAPGKALGSLTLAQTDEVLASIRLLVRSMLIAADQPTSVEVASDPQTPETVEMHLIKQQERMNRALQSLGQELQTLGEAFRILQNKEPSRDGPMGSGSHSDGDS